MKRVILTGADGFIGRQAIPALLHRDYEIHAVSNIEPSDELRVEGVTWHKFDLLDRDSVKSLTMNIKNASLLHFAWYVEPGKFWDSPKNRLWLQAGKWLIDCFREHGGERAVMAGTCAEYDLDKGEDLTEGSSELKPSSLYGACKLELQQYLAESGLDWSWGRVFFLYGEYESRNRLVASVINSLLNEKIAECSHGMQRRDFLYGKDVADAFAELLASRVGGAVNIASGVEITVKELVIEISEIVGRPDGVVFGARPTPEDEPRRIVADVQRLFNEVRWKPKRTLEQGLTETVEWWKQNPAKY